MSCYAYVRRQLQATRDVAAALLAYRECKVFVFILGTILSLGATAYDATTLDICILGYHPLHPEGVEEHPSSLFIGGYFFGVVVDLLAIVGLACTYRRCLSATNVYLVPLEEENCMGKLLAYIFVPLGTFFTGIFVAVGAVDFARAEMCDGNGGEGLATFIEISAIVFQIFIAIFATSFILFSVCIFACDKCIDCVCCSSTCSSGKTCCVSSKACMHRLLFFLVFVDTWWKLLGVIVSFRSGSFGLFFAVLLIVLVISGEMLAHYACFLQIVANEGVL